MTEEQSDEIRITAALESTGCCAFTHLRVAFPFDEREVDAVVARHAQTVKEDHSKRLSWRGEGAPTLWCVAAPPEAALREYLQSRGWTHLLNLPRRIGYAPGVNTLWIKEFPKE